MIFFDSARSASWKTNEELEGDFDADCTTHEDTPKEWNRKLMHPI
jgi:hypothetical protein